MRTNFSLEFSSEDALCYLRAELSDKDGTYWTPDLSWGTANWGRYFGFRWLWVHIVWQNHSRTATGDRG